MDPNLYTTAQVAALLGVTSTTIIRDTHRGKIKPAYKVPGLRGGFLYAIDYIDSLVAEKAAQ